MVGTKGHRDRPGRTGPHPGEGVLEPGCQHHAVGTLIGVFDLRRARPPDARRRRQNRGSRGRRRGHGKSRSPARPKPAHRPVTLAEARGPAAGNSLAESRRHSSCRREIHFDISLDLPQAVGVRASNNSRVGRDECRKTGCANARHTVEWNTASIPVPPKPSGLPSGLPPLLLCAVPCRAPCRYQATSVQAMPPMRSEVSVPGIRNDRGNCRP